MIGVADTIRELLILSGYVAASVYINQEPDTPENTLTIYTTGSGEMSPKYRQDRETFQLRARGKTHPETMDILHAARDILLGTPRKLIAHAGDTDACVVGVWPVGGTLSMGRDPNNRVLISLNFSCYYELAKNSLRQPLNFGYSVCYDDDIMIATTTVNLQTLTGQALYEVPLGKTLIITSVVMHGFTAALDKLFTIGFNSGSFNDVFNASVVATGTGPGICLGTVPHNSTSATNLRYAQHAEGAAGDILMFLMGAENTLPGTAAVDVLGYLVDA